MSIPTLPINEHLDVKARLQQLQQWQDEWQAEEKALQTKLRLLDPTNRHDLQRSLQITRLIQRLQMRMVKAPLEIAPNVIQTHGYENLRRGLVQQFAELTQAEKLL